MWGGVMGWVWWWLWEGNGLVFVVRFGLRGGDLLGGEDEGVGFFELVVENWDINERIGDVEKEIR